MIAVAGGKGGCGKTTTVACLARAFAAAGADPVVVDADVDMPNLHVLLGGRPGPGLDALAAGRSLEQVAQPPPELPGVRLVASGTDAATDLPAALARLRSLEDPVIVDTAAGASAAVADPLRAADGVVVVSTPTRQSLEDAAKTAAMARTLDAPVLGAILTRSDGSVDPCPVLDCPVLAHVPDVETPFADERVRNAYASVPRSLSKRNI